MMVAFPVLISGPVGAVPPANMEFVMLMVLALFPPSRLPPDVLAVLDASVEERMSVNWLPPKEPFK
ncbi:hypothetical protein ASF16_05345 [Acidovorax sp. Leaf78]|nr:hypothetical protein ASF16_05345 [Acidovorax sp. Leaf78]